VWWGTIFLALMGLALKGVLGAIIGGLLGYFLIDRALARAAARQRIFTSPRNRSAIQRAFFEASFLVMGKLAKADGRVSQQEIQTASAIMDHLRLTPEQKRQAIKLFNQGKQADFDIMSAVQHFRSVCGHHTPLLQMFLEIALQAAYADGQLSSAAMQVLEQIRQQLLISKFKFDLIHQRIHAQRNFYRYSQQQQYRTRVDDKQQLADAYAVLGVSSQASDQEVKRAYRRLMSQHHPDKLVAKGLPEQMMRLAKEKTQEIQAAYKKITDARKQEG
jgi:DnaJ like chaperone protein